MRAWVVVAVLLMSPVVVAAEAAPALQQQSVQNPVIDAEGFLASAAEALAHRESRRIGERAFLRMMREPGTVVLDARSSEKFAELHIDGAINLNFSDITVDSLARLLPDRDARILIYCNNNFRNDESAFPTKLPSASLNLSTFSTLYDYGYRNVYELGPNIDANKTALPLVSATLTTDAHDRP